MGIFENFNVFVSDEEEVAALQGNPVNDVFVACVFCPVIVVGGLFLCLFGLFIFPLQNKGR